MVFGFKEKLLLINGEVSFVAVLVPKDTASSVSFFDKSGDDVRKGVA